MSPNKKYIILYSAFIQMTYLIKTIIMWADFRFEKILYSWNHLWQSYFFKCLEYFIWKNRVSGNEDHSQGFNGVWEKISVIFIVEPKHEVFLWRNMLFKKKGKKRSIHSLNPVNFEGFILILIMLPFVQIHFIFFEHLRTYVILICICSQICICLRMN